MNDDHRRPNVFASSGIDRHGVQRRHEQWIEELLNGAESRLVVIWRSRHLVRRTDETVRPILLPLAELGDVVRHLTFLGELEGVPFFTGELEGDDPITEHGIDGEFAELRPIGPLLDRETGGLLAYARAMIYWHQRHRYCGECGWPTVSAEAGHVRICTNPECGAHHFPRTDPAVIMLVTHGEHALLARQAAWTPKQYATLAGFVEPGESLEDAVAREVAEEVGLKLGNIRYHSSQPWPFPGSIMLGFRAEATDTELTLERNEIEDARWFTRTEVREAVESGEILLPPAISIARALILGWLEEVS